MVGGLLDYRDLVSNRTRVNARSEHEKQAEEDEGVHGYCELFLAELTLVASLYMPDKHSLSHRLARSTHFGRLFRVQ